MDAQLDNRRGPCYRRTSLSESLLWIARIRRRWWPDSESDFTTRRDEEEYLNLMTLHR